MWRVSGSGGEQTGTQRLHLADPDFMEIWAYAQQKSGKSDMKHESNNYTHNNLIQHLTYQYVWKPPNEDILIEKHDVSLVFINKSQRFIVKAENKMFYFQLSRQPEPKTHC